MTFTGTLPPLLNAEEEAEVMKKLASAEGRKEAERQLVEHNLRLVFRVLKKFQYTGINDEDMFSIGTIGLVKAASTYRPEKKIKFSTFATCCIYNEIGMYVRDTKKQRSEVSLDEPMSVDAGATTLADVLPDKESLELNLEKKEDCSAVLRAIRTLAPRERAIIELRYGLNGRSPHTQAKTAQRIGVTKSRISRIEIQCLEKLREILKGKI